MSAFVYLECNECGFDSALRKEATIGKTHYCPLCAGDSGRDVVMSKRPATDDDKPEGVDHRKPTTI